jgi:hypothetical protein
MCGATADVTSDRRVYVRIAVLNDPSSTSLYTSCRDWVKNDPLGMVCCFMVRALSPCRVISLRLVAFRYQKRAKHQLPAGYLCVSRVDAVRGCVILMYVSLQLPPPFPYTEGTRLKMTPQPREMNKDVSQLCGTASWANRCIRALCVGNFLCRNYFRKRRSTLAKHCWILTCRTIVI